MCVSDVDDYCKYGLTKHDDREKAKAFGNVIHLKGDSRHSLSRRAEQGGPDLKADRSPPEGKSGTPIEEH